MHRVVVKRVFKETIHCLPEEVDHKQKTAQILPQNTQKSALNRRLQKRNRNNNSNGIHENNVRFHEKNKVGTEKSRCKL